MSRKSMPLRRRGCGFPIGTCATQDEVGTEYALAAPVAQSSPSLSRGFRFCKMTCCHQCATCSTQNRRAHPHPSGGTPLVYMPAYSVPDRHRIRDCLARNLFRLPPRSRQSIQQPLAGASLIQHGARCDERARFMIIVRLTYYSRNLLDRLGGPIREGINDILIESVANNRCDDVTGALIYDKRWFAQTLEG